MSSLPQAGCSPLSLGEFLENKNVPDLLLLHPHLQVEALRAAVQHDTEQVQHHGLARADPRTEGLGMK